VPSVRPWRTIAAIAVALMACAPAVAASPTDAASTHTFLTALERVLNATIVGHHRVAAAIEGLVEHVESTCPHAIPASLGGDGTPAQKRTVAAFSAASLGEVSVALIDPFRSAYGRFFRTIVHQRWSSQTLNRDVATSVGAARALLVLRIPDLCRQAMLAHASNFRRTPPAIRAFVKRFVALASPASPSTDDLLALMKPLADPRDGALLKSVRRLEGRINGIDSRVGFRGANRLFRALSG
jgi:hypothetical protein